LVFVEGVRLAAVGLAAGMLLALLLTRYMSSLLYGVGSNDPLAFAGVAALIALVACLACLLPARRATRVDPVVALRGEGGPPARCPRDFAHRSAAEPQKPMPTPPCLPVKQETSLSGRPSPEGRSSHPGHAARWPRILSAVAILLLCLCRGAQAQDAALTPGPKLKDE